METQDEAFDEDAYWDTLDDQDADATADDSDEGTGTEDDGESGDADTVAASGEPEDYKALYSKAQAHIDTQNGRLRAAEQRLKELEASLTYTPQVGAQPPAPPQQVDPDDEFLQQFEEEFQPEVLRAIEIISRRKASEAARAVREEIAPRLSTAEQAAAIRAQQEHYGRIQAAVPDIGQIAGSQDFEDWLQSTPAHLRPAYQFIKEQGDADQVIGMLNDYKQARGARQKPTPRATPAANAVPRRRGTAERGAQAVGESFSEIWEQVTGGR